MKIKRLSAIGSALVLSIASLLTIAFPQIAHAAAPYTCTWTGAGSDSNFSTADNWSNCNSAAPVATDDDDLVFDVTDLSSDQTLNNDISGLTVDSITFQGTNSSNNSYTITGDGITVNSAITDTDSTNTKNDLDVDITLGGDVTLTESPSREDGGVYFGTSEDTTTLDTAGYPLSINGSAGGNIAPAIIIYSNLSGSGSLTDNLVRPVALLGDSPSYTGAIDVTSGAVGVYGSNALANVSGFTVESGAVLDLLFSKTNDITSYGFPVTLAGGTLAGDSEFPGLIINPEVTVYPLGEDDPSDVGSVGPSEDGTLSGQLTLTADSQYTGGWGNGGAEVNTTITGTYNSGDFSLTDYHSNGKITLPDSTVVTPPAQTINYELNSTSSTVAVTENVTAIVDGEYGFTTVSPDGILKGDGTVDGLYVLSGGTVSPGHSPGCMTVSGDLQEGGTYQAEIGGTTACTGYDQLIVSSGYSVILDDGGSPPTQGVLQVSLINGFVPTAGETFEIINNEGSQPVSDTFSGLPEGATFTVSGVVFKISYVGGDGNDVVLTAISVPKTPDTGFGLTSYDVGLPLLGTALLAGGTYLISRRFNQPTNKKI